LSKKEELLEEERRLAAEEKERIRQQKEAQKAALEAERAKRAAAHGNGKPTRVSWRYPHPGREKHSAANQ
jgi:hypothetical protein